MAGNTLVTASSLQCPHGGTVMLVSSSPRVKAAGTPVVNTADNCVVVGCPFQLPTTPPTPSPCLSVRWLVADTRVKVVGQPTLSMSSSGICLSAQQVPQGPVVISGTQPRVKSL